jgi:hypothetical protein
MIGGPDVERGGEIVIGIENARSVDRVAEPIGRDKSRSNYL